MKPLHYVEYFLFELTGSVVRLLPLQTVQRLGAWMGEKFSTLLGFRRGVTLDNLHKAYPEKSESELNAIATGAYRNIGTTFFELMWFPRLTRQRIGDLVRIEGLEFIREAKARGRGIILLTAHFGNWELLAAATSLAVGSPVLIVVKPQANPLVDKEVNRWRTLFGNSVVPMGVSVREILRALHNGDVVGIVADQSAPMENIAVEFFGRMVPTHLGPAVFCLKTGAALFNGVAVRQPDGTYCARFDEVPTSDLGGYSEESVAELTRRHVKMSEELIRAHPDQWMWMHKRWKHAREDRPATEQVSTE